MLTVPLMTADCTAQLLRPAEKLQLLHRRKSAEIGSSDIPPAAPDAFRLTDFSSLLPVLKAFPPMWLF